MALKFIFLPFINARSKQFRAKKPVRFDGIDEHRGGDCFGLRRVLVKAFDLAPFRVVLKILALNKIYVFVDLRKQCFDGFKSIIRWPLFVNNGGDLVLKLIH